MADAGDRLSYNGNLFSGDRITALRCDRNDVLSGKLILIQLCIIFPLAFT
ncbi:hypothetical protein [Nostoc sp. WHI]|nr:hypothetical protein [Nostoc sp. WHI]